MRSAIAIFLLLQFGSSIAQVTKNDSTHAAFEKAVVNSSGEDQLSNIRKWISYTIDQKDQHVFDRIEAYCQTFLKDKERLGQKDYSYAEGFISLGRIYSAVGQKERALKAFTDAFEINKRGKDEWPGDYLRNLKFIVGLCNDNRMYTPQTEPYIDLFIDEYVKYQEDPDTYLTNLMEVVRYNHHKGQPEKSIPLIDAAIVYSEKHLGKNSNEYTMFKTYRAAMDGQISKKEERAFVKAAGLDKGSPEVMEMNEYLNKGDLTRATAVLEKYSGTIKNYYYSQKNYKGYASMLSTSALWYRETGNLNKGYEMLQEASVVTKEYLAYDNDANIEMLNNEGDFLKEMGNDAKAEAKYLEAIRILDATRTKENEKENDEKYYDVWLKLGLVYRHWGYNRDAHQNFLDVAGYRRNRYGENSKEYAKALIHIAECSEALNLIGRSEWYFKKALAILKKEGENSTVYISSGEQYASLLARLMRYDEAEPYLLAARNLYSSVMGNKSGAYLVATSDLGWQYVQAKKYDKAKPVFKELIDNNLYRVQNFFSSLSESEKGIFYRRIYADINSYNVFANRYVAINKEEAGNMFDVQLNTKGLLFKSTNRVKETILQSSDDSLRAGYDKWLEAKDNLSKIYQMSADQKKANGINDKAWEDKVNQLERKLTKRSQLFSNLLIEKPTWKTVQQKLSAGEAAIEMVKLIEPKYEYFYWKIDKGFMFDSLSTGEWSIYNVDSDRTPAHKAGVRTRDVLLAIDGIPLKGKNEAEIRELYKKNTIELTLKRDSGAPFKVKVKDDSVFYIAMDRHIRYAALILTPDMKSGPELVTLENGNDLENRYARYYQNAIKQKLDDPYSYNQFWKPFQSKLAGIRKVYFSPDGAYNFINPSTLFNPSTKKYVLDELEVAIVNNTSDILVSKPKGNLKKATLIGFPEYNKKVDGAQGQANLSSDVDYRAITADSSSTRFMNGSTVTELPGTRTEVNGIESILKQGKFDVSKLMMAEATEEKVKSLRSPDVLHIATHGFFMNELSAMGEGARSITGITAQKLTENPLLRSGLLFAGSGETIAKGKEDNAKEDGILTAYEAMNLDLSNTELVVLSACETGLGQVKSGEGVYGLNRAFRAAGAKSVLMSLWKVDDAATQQLMTEFYREWLKGSTKLQAFRKAQLKLRESFSHPYYWGAFVAVGD